MIKNVALIIIITIYGLTNALANSSDSDKNRNPASQSSANEIILDATSKNRKIWPRQYDLAIFEAVDKYGSNLIEETPRDLKSWCPAIDNKDTNAKKLFYSEILYKLTDFESDFLPMKTYRESFTNSRGERVISTGLVQLSYESVNNYKCSRVNHGNKVTTSALKDPKVNLQCAVIILNKLIGDNNVVSGSGCSSGQCGAARYWSPFRKKSRLSQIMNHVKNSPVCTGKAKTTLTKAKTKKADIEDLDSIDSTKLANQPKKVLKSSDTDEIIDIEDSVELSGYSLNKVRE